MFLKSDWTKHTYFYFTLILSLLVLFFATFLLTFEKKESIDAVKQIESYVVVYFNGDWQEWRHAVDDTYTVNGYTIYGANGDYGVDSGTSNRFDWSEAWVKKSSSEYFETSINPSTNSWSAVQFKVFYNNFRSEYFDYSVEVKYSGDDRVYQTIHNGTLSSNGQIFDIGSKVSSVLNSLICCRAYFDVTPKSFPVKFYTAINKQQKDPISNSDSVSWEYGEIYGIDSSITNAVKSKNYTGYHWDQENTWWDGDFKQQNSNGAIVMYTKDDCKFYANFVPNTYTIKYDGNGATGGSTVSSSHTYDSSKNLTKNGFEKKGYHFVGWSTSKNGSKAYSDGQSVKNLTSTNGGTITLYAKWEPNTYTVNLNLQGGGGATSPINATYDKVINISNPTKTGYKFTGWSVTSGLDATTAKSGTSNSLTELTKWDGTKTKNTYFANLTAKNKGTVELSAQWESYVLTYSFNSGGGSSHTGGTAYYGGTITLPTPTKTGYTFSGWKHNNNNKVYQAGGYSVNSDIANSSATVIFIAQWHANKYTINLNLQGGSGVTSPINATYDKVINIPNPAKTGYTFTGWSETSGLNTTTAKSGTSNSLTALTKWGGAATKNTYFANLTAAVNGAVTLTANWTAITYTIEFNSNGGSGNMLNQSFTYDSEKALSKNTFKRAGYIFKEWNTEKNGTGTRYSDKAKVRNLASKSLCTVAVNDCVNNNY